MPRKSPFPDLFIPDRPPSEIVLAKTLEYTKATALIDGETKQSYTFLQVRNLSLSIAAGLEKAGLRKGDVVVIDLPNCPEWAFVFLGVSNRGGTVSGLNPAYTEYEIKKQFDDCKCKFVFTNDQLLPEVEKAAKKTQAKIKKIFVLGKKFRKSSFIRPITELYEFGPQAEKMKPVKIWTKSDVVVLPYSSGTTGPPKGVMLTHYNLIANMMLAGNETFFKWPLRGEAVLGFLPFSHMFGFFVLLNALRMGVTVVTVPRFEPQKFLQLVQDYQTKMLLVVPPVLLFLAKHPMVSDYDISCVDTVLVGAAPLGKDLSEEAMDRHPNIKFMVQGYGMTETVAGAVIMPPTPREELRHGSCGLLLPNYECKIIDPETGKELGDNEKGEICFRSPCTMKGYFGRDSATAATIDKNGWLHTGDIGYFDEEEFLYVVDRLKELIKYKGFQVPPAELEDLLLSHPQVADCAVIGIPDAGAGELPKAFVVRKSPNVTEAQIEAWVAEKVAPYKRLRGGVVFMEVIPKSPSGKILRRLLRDQEKNRKSKL